MTSSVEWVAVDWGTSNVRAWGIAADGGRAFVAQSDKGMGKLRPEEFSTVLSELVDGRAAHGTDVVVCGMAGARQGWLEAPYLDTPADLHRLADGAVKPEGIPFSVRILPGVCQRAPGREDVMRGEETQLLGLLGLSPGFEGTAILPGTHSKWVEIAGGRIVRFATAMTGELYEILSVHSVLRHSFTGTVDGPATEEGVAEGMAAGLESPGLATSLFFRTRAAALLSGKGADWCSGYLSGLLVGTEVGGHRDWLSPGATVPLIGSARFGRLYGAALTLVGMEGRPLDASEATVAGLSQARSQK